MRLYPVKRLLIWTIAALMWTAIVLTLQPSAADAANPLFINARLTEPVTKVNQMPKVVQTYGNRGSNKLVNVEAFCEYGKLSPQWAIDLNFNAIDRPQTMIAGQNTNRETPLRTIAPGKVEVECQVSGRDAITNEQFTAYSPPITLTVNR
jgi:hypothetical protein